MIYNNLKGKHKKGFTLVECLAAFAVLMLITTGVISGFVISANITSRVQKMSVQDAAVQSYVDGVVDPNVVIEVFQNMKYEITFDNGEKVVLQGVLVKLKHKETGETMVQTVFDVEGKPWLVSKEDKI